MPASARNAFSGIGHPPRYLTAKIMPRTPINISPVAAMCSPLLFEPYFHGDSWATWRAVIRAAYAEPMTARDIELFRAVAARDPPTARVKELVCAVGRGGGKDSIASLLAACSAINFVPPGKLRLGEKARIICLACDKAQATIAFDYIAALFQEIPALKALVTHVGAEVIALRNRVSIEVHAASHRAIRGRSVLCCIFDEAAFFRSEESASPDTELDLAVQPSLDRTPNSMKIIISSVHKRAGLLHEKVREFYGKNDSDTLVIVGTTLQLNPSYDAKIIERALEKNYEKYAAEYNCVWRDDLSAYISQDLLDAALDPGAIVRPPVAGAEYQAACDASGGRGSSFTVAIAHKEPRGIVVLDLIFETKSPFNPSVVVAEIAAILKDYGIASIVGDNYGAGWVVEAFSKVGIKYIKSERERSLIYQDCLPLFTSGRVRLLDGKRLVSQFASLDKKTFSTGRVRVDKGPDGDDLANAAALALTLVGCESAPTLIKYHDFFVNGQPIPDDWDARVSGHYVYFFSAACDASGRCAVISWAGSPHLQPTLVLRNFETGYFSERRFSPHARLLGLCYSAASTRRVAAIVEGLIEATCLDVITDFGIAATAASLVEQGLVKITKAAHEKSSASPLTDALNFRFDRLQDPLPCAAIAGAYLGLHGP